MDPFRNISSIEGCSSSESGWTTYIASPVQEDDAECSNTEDADYDNHNRIKYHAKDKIVEDDNESDDSMASDASSGPSHHHHLVSSKSKDSKAASGFGFKRNNKQSKHKSTRKQEKKSGEKSTKRSENSVLGHDT
ncbi:uncharacterized protein Pyn_14373 [Prunus yedoensis var. nudiflora]|uniref:Uncharacterized protein n=1 Tax=Prunus yedoensis var. nudiflora TaxID=2094558 RepID=A0A314UPM6_PRUYE|nr:uncharacterized protein Pyn_14373 [Prunus yedoensis var. nudiflora]